MEFLPRVPWASLSPSIRSCFLFSHSVMSNSLRPHELQQARLPCPSPSHLLKLMSIELVGWFSAGLSRPGTCEHYYFLELLPGPLFPWIVACWLLWLLQVCILSTFYKNVTCLHSIKKYQIFSCTVSLLCLVSPESTYTWHTTCSYIIIVLDPPFLPIHWGRDF